MLQNNPRKWQLSSKNKSRLLLSLLLTGTILITGCSTFPIETKSNDLLLSAVPSFPAPHSLMVGELKEIRQKVNCPHLKDWLGKLMVFERQLAELKKSTI